jgi:hypothetical protein
MSEYVAGSTQIVAGRDIWLSHAPTDGVSFYERGDEMMGYANWIGKVLQINRQPGIRELQVPEQLYLPATESQRGVKIWYEDSRTTRQNDPHGYTDPGEDVGTVFVPITTIHKTVAGLALAPARVATDYENVFSITRTAESHGGGERYIVAMGDGDTREGYSYDTTRHLDRTAWTRLLVNNIQLRGLFAEAIQAHLGYSPEAFEAGPTRTVAEHLEILKSRMNEEL